MGNEWFIFYDFYNAEAITSSGQYLIQLNSIDVNKYMNKIVGKEVDPVIYNDTDSIAVSLSPIVEKMGIRRDHPGFIDALCKFADTKLNPVTDKTIERIVSSLNLHDNRLSFKREKIFTSGLYIAKKKYALLVVDEEGVRFAEPKVKITGLEVKRSDTPLVCRNALKECIDIILKKDEGTLQKFIADFKQKFPKLSPIEYGIPTGVNNLVKYSCPINVTQRGTQSHIRAALYFNRWIDESGLSLKYEPIDEGAKIKIFKLKQPNPLKRDVMAVTTTVPPEMEIEKYIDIPAMLEHTFMSIVQRYTEAAGWNTEPTATLDDWW